jgi:hypothetical protein
MEFFQSLLKSSGMSSSFANWMAPTLDPDELERKIVDLRVVLQWLEANVRLTQATIQGLEVQRMTLSTLKTMNVDFGDLASHLGSAMRAGAEAMGAATQMGVGEAAPEAQGRGRVEEPRESPAPGARGDAEAGAGASGASRQGSGGEAAKEAAQLGGLIDPVQWWGSLSEQFAKVASEALRDGAWVMPGGTTPSSNAGGASAAPAAAPKAAAPAAKAGAARKRPAAPRGAKSGAAGARSRKAPGRAPG